MITPSIPNISPSLLSMFILVYNVHVSLLCWASHCSKVCSKSNKTLVLLRRILKPCSEQVIRSVHPSPMVRPISEYALPALNQHTNMDVFRIEEEQKNVHALSRIIISATPALQVWSHCLAGSCLNIHILSLKLHFSIKYIIG